jgi:Lipoxygenase
VSLKGAMRTIGVNKLPPLEYWFSFSKSARVIQSAVKNAVGLAMTKDEVDKASPEEKYKAIFTKSRLFFNLIPNPFNFVPEPTIVKNEQWSKDGEFARQFLIGVNPIMIQVVDNLADQVTPELRDFFGREDDKAFRDLARYVLQKRLLKVDYEWLMQLEKNPHQAYPLPMNKKEKQVNPRYFQKAPMVLLKLNPERTNLKLLGIQLERGTGAKVYTSVDTDEATWTYVKQCGTSVRPGRC